jgi:hypothetical protein
MEVSSKNLIPGVQYRIHNLNKVGTYHSNSGTYVRFIMNRTLLEVPITCTIYSILKTRKNKSRKIYT